MSALSIVDLLFFPESRVYFIQTVSIGISKLIFWENKTKIINLSSAEIAQSGKVKVKFLVGRTCRGTVHKNAVYRA